MAANGIETLHLDKESYPEAIAVINKLAKLQRRSPHDTARLLIEDKGQEEIDRLKKEKEEKAKATH